MELLNRIRYMLPMLLLGLLLTVGCTRRFKLDRDESSPSGYAWPLYRDLPTSQASKVEGNFSGKLDVCWEQRSNDKPAGPLTLSFHDLIYPGTRNKIKVYARKDGAYKGYIKAGGNPQTGMAVGDSLGFFAVGPYQNDLKCINLLNRKQLWDRRVKDAAAGSIIVQDLLIVSSGKTVEAFDRQTGKTVWSVTVDGRISAPASFAEGRLYQPSDDGTLYALDIKDGSELYRVKLDGPIAGAVAIGDLVYATDVRGEVAGVDPASGEIRWRITLDGPIWTSPSVAGGQLYVGHSGGGLVAIDGGDGRILWQYDAVDVIRASALVVNDYVIFGTMSGKLYSLKRTDGSVVQSRQLKGAIVQTPVSDGTNVYVATDKGYILCFGESHEPGSQPD